MRFAADSTAILATCADGEPNVVPVAFKDVTTHCFHSNLLLSAYLAIM